MAQVTSGKIMGSDWLTRPDCRSFLSRNRSGLRRLFLFENFSNFVSNSAFTNFHCCCFYLDI